MPAPPYAGASPPTPEQALLMLSLTYGAGLRPAELAAMEVDALLDDNGGPSQHVHVRPATTTHFVSRSVPMHPDVVRDVVAFRERHHEERFVAFVPSVAASAPRRAMGESGLMQWFRRLFDDAGVPGLTAHSGRKMFCGMQRRAGHG
jgi:integrase